MIARAAILVAVAALLAGCPPTNLLKATIAYGTASDDVTSELADTANLMTSICHERAEIEYLSSQFEQLSQPTSFAAFYEHQTHELPDLGTLATWKDQCTAYRALDQRFSKLVHVVGAYGTALAAFAADNADAGTPLGAVIKSIGTDVATALPAAAPYKAELSGAGDPIGRVATALQQRWKAKHLGALVTTLAPDVDTILSALAGYIEAVRTREIGDARGALGDLMEQLHSVNSVGSAAPPGTLSSPPPSPAILDLQSRAAKLERRLALEQQMSAAFLEVEIEGRLATLQRRLARISALLVDIRAAHEALVRAWQAGEGDAAAAARTISELTREIRAEIHMFENPVTGAGS